MEDGRYWNSFLPIFLDRIGNIMRNHMAEEAKEYSLSSAHCTYIVALSLLDGPTSSQLSYFLDMDNGNTFRAIQTLIEKGLVTTDRKTEKSRKYHIYLTPEGERLAKKIMDNTTKFMDKGMEGISDEDLENMRATLVRILKNIDPGIDDYLSAKAYSNPYFSYLNVIIPNDDGVIIVPKRVGSKLPKEGFAKTTEVAHEMETFPDTDTLLKESESGKQKASKKRKAKK